MYFTQISISTSLSKKITSVIFLLNFNKFNKSFQEDYLLYKQCKSDKIVLTLFLAGLKIYIKQQGGSTPKNQSFFLFLDRLYRNRKSHKIQGYFEAIFGRVDLRQGVGEHPLCLNLNLTKKKASEKWKQENSKSLSHTVFQTELSQIIPIQVH